MSQTNIDMNFAQIDQVTACLKVMSNPDRLKILCVLVDGELNVQEIEEKTQIFQPTLSQQLTVLRKQNIVSTRRAGKQIYYEVSDAKVLAIMQKLYQLYCGIDAV